MNESKRFFWNGLFFNGVLVVCVTLLSINVWSSNPSRSVPGNHGKDTPFIVLRSSGNEPNGESRQSREGPQPLFASVPGALVTSSHGYGAYQDGDSMVVTLDLSGKQIARFQTYPVVSLAVRNNGNIVVASPVKRHFLHEYSGGGQLLRSYGAIKNYGMPHVDDSEMRFLRRGQVLIDEADNLYYVFRHIPLLQKYSPSANLIFERQVAGEAINLQQELAQRFLKNIPPGEVGGIDVINSAAIEKETQHLWLCLNGSSVTAVVYEYSERGEKIREYALSAGSPLSGGRRITGPKGIAVTALNLYVLTDQESVLTFNLLDASTVNSEGRDMTIQDAGPCGTAQEWLACPFTCPGVACSDSQPTATSSDGTSLDCKAALQASLTSGYVVIQPVCNTYQPGTAAAPPLPAHMRGGCKSDVVICRAGDNNTHVNSSHSATLDCPAPPSSACSGGGGSDPGPCEGVICGAFQLESSGTECCPSPILVDIAGDGFSLTDAAGGVNFDLNRDGIAEHLAWTSAGSDDAFLALDRNGNGRIDSGLELFGNYSPQSVSSSPNGFLALAEYDKPAHGGNNDGRIDSHDAIFSSLRLWQDANHNGVSEPGELHTLPQLGVYAFGLNYKESKRTGQYRNGFRYRAKVYDVHGASAGRWTYSSSSSRR